MTTSVYRKRLEDELAFLTRRTVNARRVIERTAPSCDLESLRALKRELDFAEARKAELRYHLGLPEPGPAVPLALRPAERAALARRGAVRIAPATRRAIPGYVCKAMVPGR